ncbi:hypothetical protein JKP22_22655 [Vibrio vulnificus]|uniref:Uncharacterized protein n=1 Tax=Vibrio fortis TaxID=212667 RepID=A0A5N3SBD0_9VIBR|nr:MULTISPECIES: hypothetical protein [Vibrio]HCG6617913.1 hypothetical protein [Vibrio parahaemolyticus]KAB0304166.1 hypothetical protein F2Z80_09545 [Vibrio fortis]MCA4015579.1 hypothetical protein [Vibrio vulnificus]TCT43638.1 hypothetical protein EDB29_101445 [Vibrio crassostreae]HAS8561143.1 hypothetical protein [Vibrio vulnificus]
MDFLVGVDLQDSFVLGWNYCDQTLEIELEFSIWPESEYYKTPKVGEYTCYRLGSLLFNDVSSITGLLNQSDIQPTLDPDGSKDYGNIEYFEKNQSCFKVVGSFGTIEFESSDIHFELRT